MQKDRARVGLMSGTLIVAVALASCGSDTMSSAGSEPVVADGAGDAADNSESSSLTELAEVSEDPVDGSLSETLGVVASFGEAIEARDLAAAKALVSSSDAVDLPGWGDGLAGSLEWYGVVDWTVSPLSCTSDPIEPTWARCSYTVENAWSKALHVPPVPLTMEYAVSDGLIMAVGFDASFYETWGEQVFGVFYDWVQDNNPTDADFIWNHEGPATPEFTSRALDLFAANTEAFVADLGG